MCWGGRGSQVAKPVAHYNAGQVSGIVWPAFGGLQTEQKALALIKKFSAVIKSTDVPSPPLTCIRQPYYGSDYVSSLPTRIQRGSPY